jgi:vacuolar-type H+-ATPase subunit H
MRNKKNKGLYYKQYYIKNYEKILERNREQYKKNREKILKKSKQYYQKNKEKIIKRNLKYKENNKDKYIGYRKKHYRKHREKILKYHRDRIEIFIKNLGGKCFLCGFNNRRALQIHHKNGEKEQKRDWIKKNFDTNKIQLLCANCHAIIHYKNKYG